eukprot:TRINITY_DN35092_c0_g1_i1.p1 TRINITY_DN35092_c0_g1~~TRINITY_DN35092_c0_g1_i1.p1  ORF type:complete len:251 (-),score=36.26 TRINITY_DN35092_c0_g1_i1:91-783(-)
MKLTYFDARGRAEAIRLVFALAGVEFEDVRFSEEPDPEIPFLPKEFVDMQKSDKCPTKQVPFLEVEDGQVLLYQRGAIMRFLGRKYNLVGSTEVEYAQIDAIICTVNDMFDKIVNDLWFSTQKEQERKANIEKWNKEVMGWPRWGQYFEKLATKANSGSGFLVGNSLSIADVAVADFVIGWKETGELVGVNNLLDAVPALKQFSDNIMGQPKIKAYYAEGGKGKKPRGIP